MYLNYLVTRNPVDEQKNPLTTYETIQLCNCKNAQHQGLEKSAVNKEEFFTKKLSILRAVVNITWFYVISIPMTGF